MRAGIKGQADVYGIARGGRHVEIEVKNLKGKLTPEQVAWQRFCTEWGISHVVVRPGEGESDEEAVARWCGEIRRALLPKDRAPGWVLRLPRETEYSEELLATGGMLKVKVTGPRLTEEEMRDLQDDPEEKARLE